MKYKITLNGRTYEVEVDQDQAMLVDEYEAYAPAPAAPAAPAAAPAPAAAAPAPAAAAPVSVAAGEVVAAPMPGNILSVNVAQGAAVKSGDILVILEAMKMENEILAPRDGTVAQSSSPRALPSIPALLWSFWRKEEQIWVLTFWTPSQSLRPSPVSPDSSQRAAGRTS